MLTPAQLRVILSNISYRPNWEFSLIEGDPEGPKLRILATVENSYQPGKMLDLGISTYIPPCRDEQAFLDFLAYRLGRVEIHEAREWLRYKGELVDDPHKEEAA